MEIYKRPDKSTFKEAQWDTREHRQLNKIRKTIHEQNEKFNKNIETIQKEPNRNSGAEEYNE